VKTHLLLAAIVAAVAIGMAWLSGDVQRPALIGAVISSGTALASLWAFGRFAGGDARPVQRALVVFGVAFLVRLLLVVAGVVSVHRAHESIIAFVVAFFVPYFVFTAIEGSAVASLGRGLGKPA
jgi:hypothetical protein